MKTQSFFHQSSYYPLSKERGAIRTPNIYVKQEYVDRIKRLGKSQSTFVNEAVRKALETEEGLLARVVAIEEGQLKLDSQIVALLTELRGQLATLHVQSPEVIKVRLCTEEGNEEVADELCSLPFEVRAVVRELINLNKILRRHPEPAPYVLPGR